MSAKYIERRGKRMYGICDARWTDIEAHYITRCILEVGDLSHTPTTDAVGRIDKALHGCGALVSIKFVEPISTRSIADLKLSADDKDNCMYRLFAVMYPDVHIPFKRSK